MSQYCFDIINPDNKKLNINNIKSEIKKLYIGKDKFKEGDDLPFLLIFAKTLKNEDDSVCVFMQSRGKKNTEKIENINKKIKDVILVDGIEIKKPYLFKIKQEEWWKNNDKDVGNKKWKSLIHNGPYFTHLIEPYKQLNVKLIYDKKEYKLSSKEEQVLRFYANRILSEESGNVTDLWTKDKDFNNNYIKSLQKFLRPEYKKLVKDIKKINWINFKKKIFENKNKKLTKDEKNKKKVFAIEKQRNYGYAILDGNKEMIANYTVEPMGIFYGRGKHPKRGIIKKQIIPEDVTINTGILDDKPIAPKGHKWKNIVNDTNGTWLAKWKTGEGQIKYVWFSSAGKFKGTSNLKKYEKARKLNKVLKNVRKVYTNDIESTEIKKQQLGTVMYLIDHFGIRVGNEKGDDEADTVGASTLKVGHINTDKKNHIILDFLGKDSIRFYKDLSVPNNVYENMILFIKGKTKTKDLFDKISAKDINEYLKQFDKDFSAKVFRTRLGSTIMNDALKTVKIQKGSTKQKTKVLFNKANAKVADILNHARTMSKKAKDGLKNDKEKLKEKKKQLKDAEKKGKGVNAIKRTIESLKIKIESKSDIMKVAITTSLNNYIDPRLVVSWCLKQNIEPSYVYSKKQMEDFNWAIQMTDRNWSYENSPVNFDDKEKVTKPVKKTKPVKVTKPVKKTKPDKKTKPVKKTKTILLLGDSIIDNAHWNDVGKFTTAENLKKREVKIIDRSTEEITTTKFFENKEGIIVNKIYVDERKEKGIPYDGFYSENKYLVKPIPERNNLVWWNTNKEDRYIVLSLGGNDLVLEKNFNMDEIRNKLIKVIKKIINDSKINSNNFIYIIPYPPTKALNEILKSQIDISPEKFYKNWVSEFKKMCNLLNIRYISLEDFREKERGPESSAIPEPTKLGAEKISDRIYNKVNSDTKISNNKHLEYYKNILEFCNSLKQNKKDKELLKRIILNNDLEFWKQLNYFIEYAISKNINLEINNKIKKIIDTKLIRKDN